jgi:hypothetical protein
MGPYSLPTLQQPQSSDVFASWLIQPYQLNSAGNLPGNTTIGVNGFGVQISGPNSSIIISASNNVSQPVISMLGKLGYILFTNPTSQVNQMVIGTLPDGTTGMVSSVTGVNVLTLFS